MLKSKHMSRLVKCAVIIALVLIAFVIFSLFRMNYYLNEYGYGKNELPKTAAVYFHLSKGFTVLEYDNGDSCFIGRSAGTYNDILEKNGWHEVNRLGTVGYYKKYNGKDEPKSIEVLSSDDWCNWFRVYYIHSGKIEDILQ